MYNLKIILHTFITTKTSWAYQHLEKYSVHEKMKRQKKVEIYKRNNLRNIGSGKHTELMRVKKVEEVLFS